MPTRGGDEVDNPGELVKFVGADVGTVREAEIDLWEAQQAVSLYFISEGFWILVAVVPFLSGSS